MKALKTKLHLVFLFTFLCFMTACGDSNDSNVIASCHDQNQGVCYSLTSGFNQQTAAQFCQNMGLQASQSTACTHSNAIGRCLRRDTSSSAEMYVYYYSPSQNVYNAQSLCTSQGGQWSQTL